MTDKVENICVTDNYTYVVFYDDTNLAHCPSELTGMKLLCVCWTVVQFMAVLFLQIGPKVHLYTFLIK
jgi:hypothetical protein